METVDRWSRSGSIELNLANARGAAQLRQRRLQVPCIAAGAVFLCSSMVLRALVAAGVGILPPEAAVCVNLLALLSAVFLLLALLPTQERAIRNFALAISIIMSLLTVGVLFQDLRDLRSQRLRMTARQGYPAWYVRATVAISSAPWAVIGLGASLRLLLVWCGRRPGRRNLEQIWRIFAQMLMAFTVRDFVWFVFCASAGVDGPRVYWWLFGSAAAWSVVAYLCLSSTLRTRLQARLAERGEQATAALVVGALLGDRPLPELLSMARERFRCVSLDRVTKAMIADNEPDPELHALTERRALGDVDAFISHSWHDDPDEKWEALQRWRADFKLTMGREARVWFDKFSIDQKNIADSLAGLPIYLAGCSTLLVLMGGTYVTRLWCLVELFSFIVIGGKRAQLQIETLPSCQKGLNSLDVQDATCFIAEDRSRLLGVIEAGVGSLESFNHQVQALAAQCGSFQCVLGPPGAAAVGRGDSAKEHPAAAAPDGGEDGMFTI